MLNNPIPIFHIGFIVFMVIGLVMCLHRGRNALAWLDAVGLYLPLAHALGGLCWLLFGGYQGNVALIRMYGLHLKFKNPILLYAIIADLCLFFFLQRLYAVTQKAERGHGRFGGVVLASYLMIHASVRMVLNVFEKEDPICLDLTLTQLMMAVYILISIATFSAVLYLRPAFKTNTHPVKNEPDPVEDLQRLLFPAGLTVFYLIATFLIYYLTRVWMVWKWPIQPVASLADAYARIFFYMPVVLLSVFALRWMKKNKMPIRSWFKWGRFTFWFIVGLLASIYYCLELLVFKHHVLRGAAFWPPVIVLSVLNAFCEEIMYRFALYRAVIGADYSKWVALIVQSVIYSLIHFMVIGATLGLFSLVYGFFLGLIVQRSKSVSQAMVCHFVVDIGCIGMPMLRM